MSDTDKEFQKAMSDLGIASNYLGDGQYDGIYGKTCYKLWKACQQLNDKRIADLMALVAKKDEALSDLLSEFERVMESEFSVRQPGSQYVEWKNAKETLPLSVDDVELVEVGDVEHELDPDGMSRAQFGSLTQSWIIPMYTKLYTIKHKE